MKKIALKFASVIMLLVALALAALVFLGNSIRQISSQSQSFMDNEVIEIDTVHGIYEDYLEIYTAMYAHINTRLASVMDKNAEQIAATRADMWEQMQQYEGQITSQEEMEVYNSVKEKLTSYDETVNQILEASRSGDKETANVLVTSNLFTINDRITLNMEKLLRFSEGNLGTGKEALRKTAQQAENGIAVVSVLLIAAAAAVLLIADRILVAPIRRMAGAIQKLIRDIHEGHSDLSVRIPVETKDEIAARAGEAGRGFAVVAEEIRVLADNSKETANNIQEISVEVVEAVRRLANDANGLIEFIKERILPDYELLEKSGEQYLNDSVAVDDMMREIREGMEEIRGTMQSVTESNNGIADNVQESTQHVMEVVTDTASLAENMKEIIGALEQVSEVIENLSEQTSCFVV